MTLLTPLVPALHPTALWLMVKVLAVLLTIRNSCPSVPLTTQSIVVAPPFKTITGVVEGSPGPAVGKDVVPLKVVAFTKGPPTRSEELTFADPVMSIVN